MKEEDGPGTPRSASRVLFSSFSFSTEDDDVVVDGCPSISSDDGGDVVDDDDDDEEETLSFRILDPVAASSSDCEDLSIITSSVFIGGATGSFETALCKTESSIEPTVACPASDAAAAPAGSSLNILV